MGKRAFYLWWALGLGGVLLGGVEGVYWWGVGVGGSVLYWKEIQILDWTLSGVSVVLEEHYWPGVCGQQPRHLTVGGGGRGGLQVPCRHGVLSATAGGAGWDC